MLLPKKKEVFAPNIYYVDIKNKLSLYLDSVGSKIEVRDLIVV